MAKLTTTPQYFTSPSGFRVGVYLGSDMHRNKLCITAPSTAWRIPYNNTRRTSFVSEDMLDNPNLYLGVINKLNVNESLFSNGICTEVITHNARYVASATIVECQTATAESYLGNHAIYMHEESATTREVGLARNIIVDGVGFHITTDEVDRILKAHATTWLARNSDTLGQSPFQALTGLQRLQTSYYFSKPPRINGAHVTVQTYEPPTVADVTKDQLRLRLLDADDMPSSLKYEWDLDKTVRTDQTISFGSHAKRRFHLTRVLTYKSGYQVESPPYTVDFRSSSVKAAPIQAENVPNPSLTGSTFFSVFDAVDTGLPKLASGRCS